MSELEDKLNSLLSDPAGMAQVVQLAQQLSSTMGASPPQPASNAAPGPSSAAPDPNPAGFSSLLGSVDPKVIAKFLPMLQSLTADQSHSMQLLNALKPYLKEEKMYNRYMRNDTGAYIRMPQDDAPPPGPKPPSGPGASPKAKPSPGPPPIPAPSHRPERDILNRFLERLHLGDLDSGDLLVLLLLFMLFRENADEELLIALGLLLIL